MNNVKKLAVVFSLFTFVSCIDEDISKRTNSLEIQPNMAIPLISSSTSLIDLLPEDVEEMTFDDDGFIRVSYKEDSIAQVSSDSLLVIEDQSPTVESFVVGEINIDAFDINVTVTLDELTSNLDGSIADDILQAEEQAQSAGFGGTAYFPPIPPQSGGDYVEQGSDQFENILISEGELTIEITNNFPIEIGTLFLELRNNNIGTEPIGVFEYTNILVNGSQSRSIQLDGTLMYSEIELSIVQFSSPGSGDNPLDQSQWVPISLEEDNITLSVFGNSIVATEGSLKFPQQDGVSETFSIDMEFDDDVEMSRINLSQGTFNYSYESSVNTSIDLNIQIPTLINSSGMIFTQNIMIENTESSGLQSFSIPIDNYSFDFSLSDSINSLEVNYSSTIMGSTNYEEYNQNDQITIMLGMENLDFSLVEGYFGQTTIDIEEDVLDLDVGVLEEIGSGILLETPNLRFIVDNSINIPFQINLNLTGSSDNESVSLNGPSIDVSPGQAMSVVTSVTDFDESSGLPQLIAINPSELIYSGTAITNPSGQVIENSITPGSEILIGFEMDLPLYLRMDDVKRIDTLAINFGEDNNQTDYIDSISLKIHTENEFPFDVDLMILFTDSVSGFVLDSLDVELLDAAETDENGRTIAPNIYDSNVSLSSSQIDALINSNRLLLDITMNSFDNQNSAVRLYTDYQFNISLGAILELNIEE